MLNKIQFFTKTFFVFALMFGLVIGANIFSSFAAEEMQRVIITFDHVVNENARAALENLGGGVIKELPLVNGFVVLLPLNSAAVSALINVKGVKTIEADTQVFALKTSNVFGKPSDKGKGSGSSPSQPAESLEWGVDRIDADLAWQQSKGMGVNVAVIDTGIDKDHQDLIANLKGGINFVSRSFFKPADPAKWDDDNGHGTHVAGIIAAVDNEIGVIGVAPEANLWAVKVLNRNGSGYVSDVISGIDWAVNNGMQVINMSLGSSQDVQALHNAVDAAYNAGVVVIAAAGNSGDGNGSTNEVNYPAKYSSVIAVAATAIDDTTPIWSSEGEEVELAAPGVNIRSTWNDGLYKTISGTSMAAPHVAGTTALVLAKAIPLAYDVNNNNLWDPAEVRTVLRTTADDLGTTGFDNFYGYGLIDAEESVK